MLHYILCNYYVARKRKLKVRNRSNTTTNYFKTYSQFYNRHIKDKQTDGSNTRHSKWTSNAGYLDKSEIIAEYILQSTFVIVKTIPCHSNKTDHQTRRWSTRGNCYDVMSIVKSSQTKHVTNRPDGIQHKLGKEYNVIRTLFETDLFTSNPSILSSSVSSPANGRCGS